MTDRQAEIIEDLKARVRVRGLWNSWLTDSDRGLGLTTVEHAYLAEEMGCTVLAPEAFNCNAPESANVEVLERDRSDEQKARWLPRMLAEEIRSADLVTDAGRASSDATAIALATTRDGDVWRLYG